MSCTGVRAPRNCTPEKPPERQPETPTVVHKRPPGYRTTPLPAGPSQSSNGFSSTGFLELADLEPWVEEQVKEQVKERVESSMQAVVSLEARLRCLETRINAQLESETTRWRHVESVAQIVATLESRISAHIAGAKRDASEWRTESSNIRALIPQIAEKHVEAALERSLSAKFGDHVEPPDSGAALRSDEMAPLAARIAAIESMLRTQYGQQLCVANGLPQHIDFSVGLPSDRPDKNIRFGSCLAGGEPHLMLAGLSGQFAPIELTKELTMELTSVSERRPHQAYEDRDLIAAIVCVVKASLESTGSFSSPRVRALDCATPDTTDAAD